MTWSRRVKTPRMRDLSVMLSLISWGSKRVMGPVLTSPQFSEPWRSAALMYTIIFGLIFLSLTPLVWYMNQTKSFFWDSISPLRCNE